MDDESEYESAIEHSLPSSKPPFSDSKGKRLCGDCGRYVDEDILKSAGKEWTCDECNSSTRVLDDYNESASSSTNPVQDSIGQAASSSRTNQVDKEVVHQKIDSCIEVSATHEPSQIHTTPAVEEASPPTKKQKKSDKDTHSDSESAK